MSRSDYHKDADIPGMKINKIFHGERGVVRIAHDTQFDTYSIGFQTRVDSDFKLISKELYELLHKELVDERRPLQKLHDDFVERMKEETE